MLYITGDCHGDFRRFTVKNFPEQKQLTKQDCVLIAGDFGGVWDGSRQEQYWLDWLDARPFTTLFVDGNHENFDLLEQYEKVAWKGGETHRIRPSVYHLCRGQVFRLDGRTVFVMGGAASHDAPDGILRQGPALKQQKRAMDRRHARYRVEHESWWTRELPDQAEYQLALENLEREWWAVDLVVTHCAPTEFHTDLRPGQPPDTLTEFLSQVRRELIYRQWYCGHYHHECWMASERFRAVYESIQLAE